jgi:hypothetical protein
MSKITKEELEQLQDQEKKKGAILRDLGILETQKHKLLHAFAIIQDEQDKLKTALEDAYGKINVNLEDGSYEVVPEE